MENVEKKKEVSANSKKQMTLIDAIELIVEKSKNSKLCKEFFVEAHREIKFIADSYNITEIQAVLFCVTLSQGPNRVELDNLAFYLDINSIRILQYADDINALVRRRLICYDNAKKEESFSVYTPVIKALKYNEVFTLAPRLGLNCDGLFEQLEMIFDDLDNSAISAENAVNELDKLLRDNKQINFAKEVLALNLLKEEQAMLLFVCHSLINEDTEEVCFYNFKDIIICKESYQRYRKNFRSGEHELFKRNILEHCCVDGITDNTQYQLTNYAKRTLLAEMNLNIADENISNLLSPKSLTKKAMFYPDSIAKQVDELAKFFTQENYLQVQERMQKRGFRGGFACLFYGGPGTGKTETVYQLARRTGREIMVVDVPQIKSKWVGDSEKNIKAVFDRYRELVKSKEFAPILLFNEADAIISTRKSGAQNAVDKMENSIQNIILQEMESLDGIMIATTNLEENLDHAFERRFLYKIKFEKPNSMVRSKIWQQMVPELTESDALNLANAYELSGGQIENVARRHSINMVLFGEQENTLHMLLNDCATERLSNKQERRHIGF